MQVLKKTMDHLFSKDNDGVVIADGFGVVARVLDDPRHSVPGGFVVTGHEIMLTQQDVQVLR